MSCFTMSSPSSRMSRGKNNSWRWWRKCAGLAAAARSRLRRSVVRARWASAPGNLGGRRVHTPLLSVQRGHHRSFSPVYIDQLYSRQPKSLSVVHEEEEPQPSTGKPVRAAAAGDTTRAGGYKARVSTAAAAGGSKARAAAAAGRSVLLSPIRGGRGGGVENGMGEVDVRAEMFIRKFREEMRLQSQRSAEEFQAMLARGL